MSEVVAAFDVDGTLTTTDTFVPFIRRVAGPGRTIVTAARVGPRAAAVALGRADRDRLKAAVVRHTLGGCAVDELATAGREHAERIRRRWLRVDTVARLRWHQGQGHRTVVVSASLRAYLEPLAASLGIDDVLCTELEVTPDGARVTGGLLGGNCRGRAKADRLLALVGERPPVLWAYGNSAGDRELLALADHAVRLRRGEVLAAAPPAGVGQ